MKLINTLSGGYRRVMDTLLGLQTEMIIGINAPFGALGRDLVLSGCAVTNNGNGTVNIASGIMYVGGQTLRFDGAANIAADGSQAIVTGGVVTSTPWPFGDGSTKNLYSEQKAVIANQDPTNPTQIKIGLTLYNLQQYITDQINAAEPKGTIKHIYDLDGTFATNFDTYGLGVTTAWIGWALDNGNNGTPGSAGMVLVGAGLYTDPTSSQQTTYNNENTGGEINHTLTIAEMPSHTHPMNAGTEYHTYGNGGDHPLVEGSGLITGATGGGSAHNNMQPYKVCYRVVKIV